MFQEGHVEALQQCRHDRPPNHPSQKSEGRQRGPQYRKRRGTGGDPAVFIPDMEARQDLVAGEALRQCFRRCNGDVDPPYAIGATASPIHGDLTRAERAGTVEVNGHVLPFSFGLLAQMFSHQVWTLSPLLRIAISIGSLRPDFVCGSVIQWLE
jgi:hypothetical protein